MLVCLLLAASFRLVHTRHTRLQITPVEPHNAFTAIPDRHAAMAVTVLSTAQELQGGFRFHTCWKTTYLSNLKRATGQVKNAKIQCTGIFSDLLYQPWLCAVTPLRQAWLQTDNLARVEHLCPADFREGYEAPSRPVVLSEVGSLVLP